MLWLAVLLSKLILTIKYIAVILSFKYASKCTKLYMTITKGLPLINIPTKNEPFFKKNKHPRILL